MAFTKYDKEFDEILKGKIFEGKVASDYLKTNFTDEELEALSKGELINLFTKAFVVICLQLKDSEKQLQDLAEQSSLMRKHYEIYPDLVDVKKSDTHFELTKMQAQLLKLNADLAQKLVKDLPQIKKRAHIKATSSGGSTRALKDPKSRAMINIENEYKNRWSKGQRFPAGRLSLFYKEMVDDALKNFSITLELVSIKNRIEKLRKKLGHTRPKKQSN